MEPRPLAFGHKEEVGASAPRPLFGRDEHLEQLLVRARALDPITGALDRLRPRLATLLKLPPPQWMTWSGDNVSALTVASELHGQQGNELRRISVPRLVDECREASGRLPSIIDRVTGTNRPAFYRSMLEHAQEQLQTLLTGVQALRVQCEPRLATLRIDALAIQVASEGITDPINATIAQNRARTLLGSIQGAELLLATIGQTEAAIVTGAGNIDRLLSEVLPQWALALNRAQR
jgi:hypothetical protein